MSRNDVAVGTESDSVMFATNRADGPVIGLRPGGSGEWGVGLGGGTDGTTPRSPLPDAMPPLAASDRDAGITGSSASFPLSNSSRHSWPTEEGSRRYCSYITWTNAALWVPKTNSLTGLNLKRIFSGARLTGGVHEADHDYRPPGKASRGEGSAVSGRDHRHHAQPRERPRR